MKYLKMLGLALVAAIASMAILGAGSASAAVLNAESCMKGKLPQECKTASVGTTFEATTSTVKLSNAFITNTCHGTVGGKVLDPSSETGKGEADKLTAEVISSTFTECSFTPAEALKAGKNEACGTNCGWILESNADLWFGPTPRTFIILEARVRFPSIGCVFAEDATHVVKGTWTNAEKSKVELSGSMKRIEGSEFFCGNEGAISGSYEVSKVTDPALSETTNVQIL